MNDRVPAVGAPHEPIFVVKPKETVVPSDSFGKVVLRTVNVRRWRELTASIDQKDPEKFGYELVCEMARGPNGERFTMSAIQGLPAHALPDLHALVDAAVLLCGYRPHDAKKV
ncbi:hypothetical protein [Paraburkholderia bannensis]|uniref:hypothetical protein n=1 Tax=Paraburkholderia bannensis TaxID=765414 RepID=UPI002AC354C6|nr:hypothetical protein [Paraburkholderia bannensis]